MVSFDINPDAELHGEIVTWDVTAGEVAYSKVRDSLQDAGLSPDEARELLPRQAFSRACKELKQNRAIDKLSVSTGIAKFQLTRKKVDETAGTMQYDYECMVELDCDTGVVKCTESPEIERQAQELIAFATQTRTSQDVTRLVQRLFTKHADLFPINPKKGVAYFVPEQHREFTAKVDDFLHRMGGRLERFPVPKGTEHGNKSVQHAVQQGLEAHLEELRQAIAEWTDETRTSTMEAACQRLEVARHKIEAYAVYLGGMSEGLADQVKDILTGAQSKIAAKATAETSAAA